MVAIVVSLRFRCLGSMEVWAGERWRVVGSAKVRALLAALLIHPGEHLPLDHLVAEVWVGSPPPSAKSLIRGYVMTLRRAIGSDGAAVVVGHGNGYRLDVSPDAIDAHRFERLSTHGRTALRLGEVDSAARVLTDALALWRGPALSDAPPTPSTVAYRARLDELRLVTVEARFEVDLRLGRHGEILGELRQLVAEQPGREGLVVQWMRALHADGRRAEALEAYVQARRRLADEFGIDPGPELRRVHQEILVAEETGAPAPAPAEPAGAPWRPWQAPADLADFTGREPEVATCLRVLDGPGERAVRVVAISGRAGVGKSALAVHLAHRLRHSYPDGHLYADLDADGDPARPGDVLGCFLRALGVPGAALPDDLDERAALFRSRLADRRMLLILDDAANERQVRPLLPGGAGCSVLLTSRSRLSALEGCHTVDLDVFPTESALALVERIVDASRVRAERSAAVALIDLCGHLPLAVRIAATRAAGSPDVPLAWSVDRLADERRRLDELSVGDLDVRASIGAGYQALAEPQRRVLRRLALLDAADVAAWVAAAVADIAMDDAQTALRALVERRLLDEAGVDRCGQLRYRFHSLVRLFARERAHAEPAAERAAAVERALAGWLTLARHADRHLPARTLADIDAATDAPASQWPVPEVVRRVAARAPFDWFQAERSALAAAVRQAAGPADAAGLAWRLAAATHGFYELRNMYDDGERAYGIALEACRRAGDELGLAVMLRNLADLYSSKPGSDLEVKLARAEEALSLFRGIGQPLGEADALYLCASVHRTRGGQEAATACLAASHRIARTAGYRLGELHVWQLLAILRRQQGRFEHALADAEQALAIAQELGSSRDQSVTLGLIGVIHRDRDEPARAQAALLDAIAIAERTADPLQMAFLHGHLGSVYATTGHADARRVLERGLALSETCRSVFGQALAQDALGRLDLSAGDPGRAVARLTEAAALYRQAQNRYSEAKILVALAEALTALGDGRSARATICAAERLLRELGNDVEADEVAKLSARHGA